MANKDSIIQVIETRKSVRSFTDETPSADILCRCGAESSPYLKVVDAAAIGNGRVGTYGVISGRPAYVAVVCKDDEQVQAGIDGERMVLALTELGIGTCWLGGTFSRQRVTEAVAVPDGARCVTVIAAGYARQHRGLVERVMRTSVRADHRMCVSDFIIAGVAPRELDSALEAVRLAPSACNRQPWRFAFNLSGSIDVYGTPSDSFMKLDVGIALAHFLAVQPHYRMTENTHYIPKLTAITTLIPD